MPRQEHWSHARLKSILSREFTDEGLRQFKIQAKVQGLREGELSRMRDIVDVFDALERKDIIGQQKYSVLKEMLRAINFDKLVSEVEDAELEQQKAGISYGLTCSAVSSSAPGTPPVNLTLQEKADTLPPEDLLQQRVKNSYKQGRGLVVIINNFYDERDAHIDETNLKNTFENILKYKVLEPQKDLNKEDLMKYLSTVRNKIETDLTLDSNEYTSLIVCISSHGSTAGIRTMDTPQKTFVTVDEIITLFNGENCKQLIGKPKVFLFQSCRGNESERGVRDVADSEPEDLENAVCLPYIRTVPVYADTLLAYASRSGTKAFRNNRDGAWFFQDLCEVINADHRSDHLLEILTTVNGMVATMRFTENNEKQMPEQVTTLTKKFYL